MVPNTPEINRSGQERWSFPRSHHLKRKRLIEPLFNRNDRSVRSVAVGSVRMVYRFVQPSEVENYTSFQIGVAVGRSAGSAVVRNRVKRVILESIRLNQNVLRERANNQDKVLTAMVIFRGKAADLAETPFDVAKCLENLNRELNK
ncbi:MAG: ribonuclease P protein component [Bacteroidetes bacterium]|nr:ribonuclease P protein component [Bacteroidota bacterium]